MRRRDFIQLSGLGMSALMGSSIPVLGNVVSLNHLLEPRADAALKKKLADVALNAAKSKGATYADVRIGRYLNQFVLTRENKVQGIINAESFGVGVRVIANGCWGFASVGDARDEAVVARAAETAVTIAKANARLLTEPVQLAPQKGVRRSELESAH
jgi:TldD protein